MKRYITPTTHLYRICPIKVIADSGSIKLYDDNIDDNQALTSGRRGWENYER